MKLSTKARYGFRFMLNLALHYGEGPVQLSNIARDEKISDKYLEKIAAALKLSGLIQVVRGAKGGYSLIKKPGDISLDLVMIALDGPFEVIDCLQDVSTCGQSESCVTITLWKEFSDHIKSFFSSRTLEDLVKIYRDKNKDKTLMYYI